MKEPNKTSWQIRRATVEDVPEIVRLLANDPLGSSRETHQDPLPSVYYQAFHEINSDQRHHLLVAEDSGTVVATLHLTILPYLTYRGGRRAQIEAVRVDSEFRGRRIGAEIIEKAIGVARKSGCHLVQLTTDKRRPAALEFYKRCGFKPSHDGMKMHLKS